jgi:hypothetical protein
MSLRDHKKGIRRTLIVIIVIIALAFGLLFSGCLFGPRCSFFGPRGIDQQGIGNYLIQKYGNIHYTVTDYRGGIWWNGNTVLTAKITDGPYQGDTFNVIATADNLGNPTYQDSYYGFLIQNQFEAMIQQVADKYFKHSIALVAFGDFSGDVSPSMSLQQVMASGKMADNEIYLYVDAADFTQNSQLNKDLFNQQTNAFGTAWSQESNQSSVYASAVSEKTLKHLSQDPNFGVQVNSSKKLKIYSYYALTNDSDVD